MKGYESVQALLAEALPDHVTRFSAEDGDRVTVEFKGVKASGVIGPRSYHWHTMRGRHNFPVVLDGTGEVVTVNADYLSLEEAIVS